MARNEHKNIKDKDKLKTIRKEARRRWRNKKALEKSVKNASASKPAKGESAKEAPGFTPWPKEEKPAEPAKQRRKTSTFKEINPAEIVRSEKSLGCGVCYLAHYRGIIVAVKELRRRSKFVDEIKHKLLHEAKIINHLGDHRSLPLLFGVVTRKEPLQLVTQFHGDKGQSVTPSTAIKEKKLGKP